MHHCRRAHLLTNNLIVSFIQPCRRCQVDELAAMGQGRGGASVTTRASDTGLTTMVSPNYCWGRRKKSSSSSSSSSPSSGDCSTDDGSDNDSDELLVPPAWRSYSHAWLWHSVVVDAPKYLAAMLESLEKDPMVHISIGELMI